MAALEAFKAGQLGRSTSHDPKLAGNNDLGPLLFAVPKVMHRIVYTTNAIAAPSEAPTTPDVEAATKLKYLV